MIVTTTYQRKTFKIQAIQVTEDNMEQLSDWTRGELINAGRPSAAIEIQCGRHIKQRARVGDWISRLGDVHNYRIYRNKTFLETFEAIRDETEKKAEILRLVIAAMNKQDVATYYGESNKGMDLVAERTASEILALL